MAKIVVIEDNPVNADLMIRLLQSVGHEVFHVERGLDGAKAIRQNGADMALVDFDLSDIDGRNLIVLIKRRFPHVKIIAVTAHSCSVNKSLSYRLGCDEFIGKPFHVREFLDVVERHLSVTISSDV